MLEAEEQLWAVHLGSESKTLLCACLLGSRTNFDWRVCSQSAVSDHGVDKCEQQNGGHDVASSSLHCLMLTSRELC